MPEPLADVLRKLHEEATSGPVLPAMQADRVVRNALPALADLVEVMEVQSAAHRSAGGGTCPWLAITYCRPCSALAALRERMGGRS